MKVLNHVHKAVAKIAAGTGRLASHACTLEEERFHMFLTEFSMCYVGGDLYEDLKQKGGRFEETRTAAHVLRPCISALMYLHSRVCPLHICQ